jgi:hypothetical protein
LDSLLRACAAGHGSDGFHRATNLLEEGEQLGLFSLGVRQSGVCTLLDVCTGSMEDDKTWDAEVVRAPTLENKTEEGNGSLLMRISKRKVRARCWTCARR